VKKPEYQVIVRKTQRRKLLEPEKRPLGFRVRGVAVEPENVDRWMKRHGIAENEIYSPGPSVGKLLLVYFLFGQAKLSPSDVDSNSCRF
jgi:hypothetical protein